MVDLGETIPSTPASDQRTIERHIAVRNSNGSPPDPIDDMIEAMDDRQARFPIRRLPSFAAMKAEEYAYWQARPSYERMDAITALAAEGYAGKDLQAHVSRLRRVAVLLKR